MEIVEFEVGVDGKLPEKQHTYDAGMDICSAEETFVLGLFKRRLVKTSLKIAVPPGYVMDCRSRSGLALKHGIMVLNSPGTIDAGYRGDVNVILMNLGEKEFEVKKGDRIAQLVMLQIPSFVTRKVDKLPPPIDERGTGGFGSTGVQ